MERESLGARMKRYEAAEAGRRLMPLLPVLARLDGRGFSTFTRGLERPFDARLSALMIEATRALVEETGARVGYTQSDEISLLWYTTNSKHPLFFDGRVQKMVSVLAALATVEFNRGLLAVLPEYAARRPVFDCRVWQVPNPEEAANTFLWRELDATKNSLSMAARARFPQQDLHGRSGAELQDMLHGAGINWNDSPASFKRGTYVQRRAVRRRFSGGPLEAPGAPPRPAGPGAGVRAPRGAGARPTAAGAGRQPGGGALRGGGASGSS